MAYAAMAKEMPVFKRAIGAGSITAGFELMNGASTQGAIQSGSFMTLSSVLSQTVFEELAVYADKMLPGTIIDKLAGFNVDIASNVSAGLIYAAGARYLRLSPVDDTVTLMGFAKSAAYGTMACSVSDLVVSTVQ